MAQITYADKTALYENQDIAAENKVRDVDMNEIKQVVNDNETKILLDVTDTAPAECSTGDMYFNTTDNLIYTATATDTWSSTGVAPTENTIYVVLTTQTSYMYDGNTLVSVGGGAGGIVVAPDIPTQDTQLYIESTDLDGQYLPVEEDIYSTTETKTNKIWVIDGVNYPVYRKEFIINNPTTGSWQNVSIGLTNIKKLEIEKAYLIRGNSSNPIPVWESDNNNVALGSEKSYGYIQYRINGFSGTMTLDITIEYTKD